MSESEKIKAMQFNSRGKAIVVEVTKERAEELNLMPIDEPEPPTFLLGGLLTAVHKKAQGNS